MYDRLGVTLEEYGESFYNDRIPGAIDALAAAGLVAKDDGADVVRLKHFTYPLIVRKRDGEKLDEIAKRGCWRVVVKASIWQFIHSCVHVYVSRGVENMYIGLNCAFCFLYHW